MDAERSAAVMRFEMLDIGDLRRHPHRKTMEGGSMSTQSRMTALEQARLVHPRPDAVTAGLFCSEHPFFLAADKVQVKYEMLRAVAVDGETIVAAATAHGYSRAEFYLVQAAFAERGMAGLLDERRGGQGPTQS